MKAAAFLSTGLFLALGWPAAIAQDSFEDAIRRMNEEFDQYTAEVTAEYEAFVQAELAAFEQFRSEVEAKWDTFKGPTKKDWVEYSDDKDTRTVVDFETGEATVEVLVEADAVAADAEVVEQRLEEAVQKLVTDRGKTMDYPVQEERAQPLGERPVLENQVVDNQGQPVTEETAAEFAQEVVKTAPVEQTEVASEDGVQRVRVTVTIKLVPNHLRVRAEKFVDTVQHYSRKYNLDPRIVFALMHTESYFNPKAKSHVPAYGLMQLVPSSGGRDAYQYVFKEDKLLPPNYLYDPGQNVELGCAFLDLIMTRYFKGTEDGLSRLYCGICAYNTGAGNVSKAFTGEKKLKPAIKRINKMSPEQVLQTLIEDLPYDETKQYIQKILDRVKYYEEWKI